MKYTLTGMLLLIFFVNANACTAKPAEKTWRVILIRHGEKPEDGDNLSCSGINRSLKLADVLYNRFGIPDRLYVPSPGLGKQTKNCRMLQTIVPFASKYNVSINTVHAVDEIEKLVRDIQNHSGTSIVCWEHNQLPAIARQLGVKDVLLDWDSSDFDSIWIVTFKKGVTLITKTNENIKPASNCSF